MERTEVAVLVRGGGGQGTGRRRQRWQRRQQGWQTGNQAKASRCCSGGLIRWPSLRLSLLQHPGNENIRIRIVQEIWHACDLLRA